MIRFTPLIPVVFLTGCIFDPAPETLRFSGETMGTTYNVTVIGAELDQDALAAQIEATLADVNAKMSNWDPNSEVSVFSTTGSTAPQNISVEFATVLAAADQVHALSGGQFDVTLGPLIELWGFGPRQPEDPIPSDADINAALSAIGQGRLLHLDLGNLTLTKSNPGVGINLSAIAKGYGIDAVAAGLSDQGIEHYMVEIGGDLVTRGQNDQGQPWRIGIETPEPGLQQGLELIVPVQDLGLATSGDYRNFFEQDGVRYSHIIDPTTGRPITHRTTSVTVLAENAMLADAWATAMLALGSERGLVVAADHNIAVYFISRDETGRENSYITQSSAAFDAAVAVADN